MNVGIVKNEALKAKPTIGITGPDFLISSGGVLNHSLNVARILSQHYNFIFVPNPKLIRNYRRNRNKVLKRIEYLKELNVRVPTGLTDALEGRTDARSLINGFKDELHLNFIINFNQDYELLSDDFTYKLAKTLGTGFGVSFHNPCFGNVSLLSYVSNSIRLSLLGGNIHSFLFRMYQYLRMEKVINNTLRKGNLKLVFIVNYNCQQRIASKFEEAHVLSPANGIFNAESFASEDDPSIKEGKMKKNQIIFFGRMSYSKGIFELFPILERILKKIDINLIIVGKFDHRSEEKLFLKKMSRPQFKGKMHYMGYLDDAEFYRVISESKVMLCTTHADSYSISILQSLYFGTPVVAYDIPANSVYKSLDEVRLVNEFDLDSFADQVLFLVDRVERGFPFSSEVAEFIAKHSWNNVAAQYKRYIDKALSTDVPLI